MAVEDQKVVSFRAQKEKMFAQISSGQGEDVTPTGQQDASRAEAERLVPDLARINKKHGFIKSLSGKPMVLSHVYNEFFEKEIVEFITPEAFMMVYSNQIAPESSQYDKNIPMGKWWLGNAHRKEYETATFEPDKPAGEYVRNNKLIFNTWEGFAIEPKRGSWKHTIKHIYEILCNKNRDKFKYVMRWLAWCVQNPGRQAEVALIFKGKKGAGKGTILTHFSQIFGRHGAVIANREHLTGKHNAHLESLCYLFADEAYNPGDREVEGILKNLITEPSLAVEPKFRNLKISRNCLHICMATNNDWVIPATEDERRYFINQVDNRYAKGECDDKKRDLYFKKIWDELENNNKEGLAAMLYDLKYMQLEDYHPRYDIPVTEELRRQITMSLPKVKTAMSYFLEEGIFPGELRDGKYIITLDALLEYIHNLDEHNYKTITRKILTSLLNEIDLTTYRTTYKRYWEFPELGAIRQRWSEKITQVDWDLTAKWHIEKVQY